MTFIAFTAVGALTVPLLLITALHGASAQVGPRSSPSVAAAAPSAAPRSVTGPAARGRSPTTGDGLAGVAAARPRARAAGAAAIGWSWPLHPRPAVVRGFSVGAHPWDPGHRGVDLAAAAGTPVLAPAAGRVHFAGVLAGRPVISLDHGHGVLSSFEPVASTLRTGSVVRPGEVIGHVAAGHSHCVPASCLHWGVRENGQYVNPLTLPGIWRGQVVLLPLGSAD